jgi:hypothetical protein
MKRLIAVYCICGVAILAGCVTVKYRNGFTEQTKAIIAIHDPAKDLKADYGAKVAVIIPQISAHDNITNQNFELAVRASFKKYDQKCITFVVGSEIEKMLTTKDLKLKYGTFIKNGPLDGENKDLQQFAKQLGFKYVVFPVVDECDVSDLPVFTQYDREYSSGDFSWPAFSLTEMQRTGTVALSMKVYPVKKIENVEDYYGKSTVSETYDTAETLNQKRRAVTVENQRRRSENDHRDREQKRRQAERERERKSHKQSKAEAVFDFLDEVLDDDERLPMIDTAKVFKKTGMTASQVIVKNLLTDSCDNLIKSFFNRYEGETLSGNTINGIGEFRFENGNTCEGLWLEGKASGICILKNNDYEYKGEFIEGYASGKGTLRTSATFYTGSFSQGLIEGEGVLDVSSMPYVYTDRNGKVRHYMSGSPYDEEFKLIKSNRKYRVLSSAGTYMQMILLKE